MMKKNETQLFSIFSKNILGKKRKMLEHLVARKTRADSIKSLQV
jgi:hypothetical protein